MRQRIVLVCAIALLAVAVGPGVGTAAADAQATVTVFGGQVPDLPFAVPVVGWILDLIFGPL